MKFRCERDVLVEALGTAGRAVANRGGALPALSGIRLEVTGDVLHLAGSDLDLTIQAETPVAGLVDGVVVVPARLGIEIVRSLDPGAVTVDGDEDEVRIAPDMRHARVFVGTRGTEAEQRGAIKALEHASNYIRHEILERLQLRRVPDLHFTLDNSQEYTERIDQLLKEMKKGNPSPK